VRSLHGYRGSAGGAFFDPLAQYHFDLLRKTFGAGESAALYRLGDETPFALGNGGTKKLAIPMPTFSFIRAQRER